MVFENGVKNIQAAAYNGAHTVHTYYVEFSDLTCLIVVQNNGLV